MWRKHLLIRAGVDSHASDKDRGIPGHHVRLCTDRIAYAHVMLIIPKWSRSGKDRCGWRRECQNHWHRWWPPRHGQQWRHARTPCRLTMLTQPPSVLKTSVLKTLQPAAASVIFLVNFPHHLASAPQMRLSKAASVILTKNRIYLGQWFRQQQTTNQVVAYFGHHAQSSSEK